MAFTPFERDIAIVRHPLVVPSHASVQEAIARMGAAASGEPPTINNDSLSDTRSSLWTDLHQTIRSSCVIVVDQGTAPEQRVSPVSRIGLLTEKDVVRLSAQPIPFFELMLQQVMTNPVVTMRESTLTTVSDILQQLQQQSIRYLPILDNTDQVIGIATPESLLHALKLCREGDRPNCPVTYCVLQDREVRSRALLSALPDYMCRIGADGVFRGIVTQNRQLDLVATEINPVGVTLIELLPEEIAARHQYYIDRAIATGELQVFEQQVQVGDRLQDEEIRIIKCADDEVLLIIRDISDRKQAETALRQSEQTNRIIIETIPDLLIQMNRQGYYSRMVGGTGVHVKYPSEGDEPDVFRSMCPELAQQRLNYAHQALESGTVQVYEQLFDIDGEQRHEEVRIAPLNEDEVLVIIRDITERKQMEVQLQNLVAGTATTTGQDFFSALVTHIAQALNVPYAIVSKRIEDELYTLAFWANGRLQSNFAYKISGTPCEQVLENGSLDCTRYVQDAFPDDEVLVDMDAESYLGIALRDAEGKAIGKLCVLSQKEIQNAAWAKQLLRVFAARASAELERQQAIAALQHMNQELEATVAARTVELREREQFLQTVLDAFPLSVFWKNRNSVYLGGNRNFLKDAGLTSVTELMGKTDDDLPWGSTCAKLFQTEDQEIVESGIAKLGLIDPVVQADGQTMWLEKNRIPLRDIYGEIIGVLGTYRDVTRRKEAEEELRRTSARLNLAIDVAAIGIWDWDIEKNVVIWDDRLYDIHGISPGSVTLVYETWFNSLHPDDREDAQTAIHQALQGEKEFNTEYRVIHPNGSIRYIKANAVVQRNEQGVPQRMTGINYDITDIKRAEEQLRLSNEELSRATRLKDEFLANMSHELRTPLNAILGMTEALQEHIFGELSESQHKAVTIIERSGFHLLALINDILDLAKIESGQMEIEMHPTALVPLCRNSLVFIQQQAFQKQIRIQTQLADNLPDVLIDERRIRQVLINLLSNAVKFTPEGGSIYLDVTCDVTCEQNGGREQDIACKQRDPDQDHESPKTLLRMSIRDTGIGIAPEHIDTVFQPFIQIDSTLSRQYQGTGLGLALVKHMVDLHNGRVSISSREGEGTCFTIEIPCDRVVPQGYEAGSRHGDDTAASGPSPALKPPPTDERPLILLIEDSEANLRTLSSYLGAKGYRLIIGRTGQEAIALTQAESPDMILMDIQLPGMDGIEAIKRIRQLPGYATTPIIALTALAMLGDRDHCLEAGASEYISKPVKLKNLTTIIQNYLKAK